VKAGTENVAISNITSSVLDKAFNSLFLLFSKTADDKNSLEMETGRIEDVSQWKLIRDGGQISIENQLLLSL
jgi:hypothetical protein